MKRPILLLVGSVIALAASLLLNVFLWLPADERSLQAIQRISLADFFPVVVIGAILCCAILLVPIALGLDIKVQRFLDKIFKQ